MKIYRGTGGAPGIARGTLFKYCKKTYNTESFVPFDEAVLTAVRKVTGLFEKAEAELGEDKAKIFSAYRMLLEDNALIEPIKALIKSGESPDSAVYSVTGEMSRRLSSKNNEYLRQRADDIKYVGELLVDALTGSSDDFVLPDSEKKIIVVARELTPVDTMQFDKARLAGFVTNHGGVTSHTVILAKSLGIPAIVGVEEELEADGGEMAYIDGYGGELIVSPDAGRQSICEKKLVDEQNFLRELEKYEGRDAYTEDGERIKISVNIGSPSDLMGADCESFDGVGLFRSEFLYSATDKRPDISDQIKAYREVLERVYPEDVVVRTIDVGGDKQISYLNMKKEENPFLGSRGIRLCLSNPEVFCEQLEAVLRAADKMSVKLLLPMVTTECEIIRAKELIEGVCARLEEEGIPYCRSTRLGIMIETPASAIAADILAKHCDFFSIGTNDLVQYITAADRGNPDVEDVYNPYHISVIRLIENVIRVGTENGKEVSVCGDIAADTNFTKLLLGLGLKKFSVPLPMVARIKHKIASISLADAKRFAEQILKEEHSNIVI